MARSAFTRPSPLLQNVSRVSIILSSCHKPTWGQVSLAESLVLPPKSQRAAAPRANAGGGAVAPPWPCSFPGYGLPAVDGGPSKVPSLSRQEGVRSKSNELATSCSPQRQTRAWPGAGAVGHVPPRGVGLGRGDMASQCQTCSVSALGRAWAAVSRQNLPFLKCGALEISKIGLWFSPLGKDSGQGSRCSAGLWPLWLAGEPQPAGPRAGPGRPPVSFLRHICEGHLASLSSLSTSSGWALYHPPGAVECTLWTSSWGQRELWQLDPHEGPGTVLTLHE